MFQDLELKLSRFVSDRKGKIIGSGTVGIGSLPSITNVLLVDRLMHNLLCISQLSDNGYDIIFNQKSCKVVSQNDGSILFWSRGKITFIKLGFLILNIIMENVSCLLMKSNGSGIDDWVMLA